jgi:hypothetical protein
MANAPFNSLFYFSCQSATLSPLFAAAVFGDGDTNQYHDLAEGFLLWSIYVKCKMNYIKC